MAEKHVTTRIGLLGATLIDGTGAPPVANSAVVLHDGRIQWVGTANEFDQAAHGLEFLDLKGRYLVPGLIDANVHLVADVDPHILLRYEPGEYDDLVVEAAQIALRAGITTVFDTWGPLEALKRVRDRINAGDVVGSRIFFAGNIIGNRGPWSPDFFHRVSAGLNPVIVDRINRHWEHNVGGDLPRMPADEVSDVVRAYIATSGIDFVKYASTAHGARHFIALSPDSQRAIVAEAHAADMVACACTMTPEALKLAIQAGVDLLQHGTSTGIRPMPPEIVRHIIDRQLPCAAVLTTERHIAAVKADRSGPWEWDKRIAFKDENDRNLIKGGAKLLLSSDGGVFGGTAATSPAWSAAPIPDSPYELGQSHIRWLQAAVERDMTPMDALLSATRNIAEAYGKADDLGTIEAGKRADLLVLTNDPLEDVAGFGRIAHVIKDGEFIDRQRLPESPVLSGQQAH